jgi:hypothetical protein
VFASEIVPEDTGNIMVNGCVMKAPKDGKLLTTALERCASQDTLHPKGKILSGILALGPELLTTLCGELDLVRSIHDRHTFAPIWCRRTPQDFVDPNLKIDLTRCYGVHMFHSRWVGWRPTKGDSYPSTCLYERLKKHYLPTIENRSDEPVGNYAGAHRRVDVTSG